MTVSIAFHLNQKIERVGGITMKKLLQEIPKDQIIVFLCIGTMNVHGDSVGPRIGRHLNKLTDKAFSIGTTYDPVHGNTLDAVRKYLEDKWKNAYIIAVDACVTKNQKNIGKIKVSKSSLRPGAGIGKDLGQIGDAGIQIFTSFDHGDYKQNLNELMNVDEQHIANLSYTIADYLANCVNHYRPKRW
jgi:putative sporulation protein YyaC